MVSLIGIDEAQTNIAGNMRRLRLEKGLTQKGLAERSGVSLASLRKFEQKGAISFESFLKLAFTLGCLEDILSATTPAQKEFKSIDEVLKQKEDKQRQRGWRK